ncbi:MAG: FliH/SctL family protein [Hyphomonadaceae bacterium]
MSEPLSPFTFETEFTPNGDVLKGPDRRFFTRDEADELAAKARAEGETRARQSAETKGFASVDRIAGHLAPVSAQLAAIADALRQEAAELAMIAARKIAGAALDKNGEEAAAVAIANAVSQLKGNPVVVISVAPDSLAQIERRFEQLRRHGIGAALQFVGDPQAKPGDWKVSWGEGSTGFSREAVEAAIEKALNARLSDPVEPQLELFSAA